MMNLYSQTPGGIHLGGGFSNLGAYRDNIMGNVFGPSQFGTSMGNFATAMPGHALNIGTGAAILGAMGIGGAKTAALGATLGMGALPMSLAIAPQLALMYGASRFRSGGQQQMFAQNAMHQVFGERDMGGRMGMGASREAAKGFANMFRDLSSSAELLTNDNELKSLFSKFNDMSLFQTVRSASEVGNRFKKLVTTVRDISRDLGTTLEGVLPMFQRHVQMGFTDPEEIRRSIRQNRALRGVGVGTDDATLGALEMSQSVANYSAGGSSRLGALGAARNLGAVNVALEQGILTDDDLMRSTRKIGKQGAADLTQQFMTASRTVLTGQSAYGQNLAAFLGKVDEQGKYTGEIDKEALAKLKDMSYEEIQKVVDKKLQKGGMSFISKMESGMGADISAQLNVGDTARIFDKIFESEQADSEEAMHILMKGLTNQRGQTVDTMLKMMRNSEGLMQESARQSVQNSIRNRLPSLIEERFSIGGRLNRAYREHIDRPLMAINDFAGSASASVGNYFDNIGNQMMTGGVSGGISALFGSGLNSENTRSSSASLKDAIMAKHFRSATGGEGQLPDYTGSTLGDYGRAALAVGLTGTGLAMSSTGAGALLGVPMMIAGTALGYTGYQEGEARAGGSKSYEQMYSSITSERFGGKQGLDIRDLISKEKFGPVSNMKARRAALMRNIRKAHANDETGDDFLEEIFGDSTSRGVEGGDYGLVRSLIEDEGTSAGERKLLTDVRKQMESNILADVGIGSQQYENVSLADLSETMSGYLEGGSGGLRNDFWGSEYGQIENKALHEIWEAGDDHTTISVMNFMMDPSKLEKFYQDGLKMTAKQRAEYLKAQGIKVTDSQASGLFDLAKGAYQDAGGDSDKAAKYMSHAGKNIVNIARARQRLNLQSRRKIMMARISGRGSAFEGALEEWAGGNVGAAREKIEKLYAQGDRKKAKEEIDKLRSIDPGAAKAIESYMDMVKASGGDEDKLRSAIEKRYSLDKDHGKSLDELRNYVLDEKLHSVSRVEETAPMRAASRLGDARKIAEILEDVNTQILGQLDASSRVNLNYVNQVKDAILTLNEKVTQ